MKGLGGRGQGKPGRGKGKGKCKGKDSGAGVGSTYANPGRPKSFQPTHQDRKQTGNIAEYFRRSDNTPKPVAPVFASAQMRGGLEGSRPRASPADDVTVTGHSTKVLDVHAAPAPAEILAGFLAEYGSGSEDADPSNEGPDVIDVDQEASQAADSRMKELRKKWTALVKKTQQGKDREEVQLPDPLIEKLETIIKSMSKRAKNARTSWSLEDKRTVLAVFKVLNRK